ncbi:hypothetical protein Pelo_17087 [Pelomyxa schiedti]|nr:hypothetical protein Pelo_17087 [Pelomyxa schiedti]
MRLQGEGTNDTSGEICVESNSEYFDNAPLNASQFLTINGKRYFRTVVAKSQLRHELVLLSSFHKVNLCLEVLENTFEKSPEILQAYPWEIPQHSKLSSLLPLSGPVKKHLHHISSVNVLRGKGAEDHPETPSLNSTMHLVSAGHSLSLPRVVVYRPSTISAHSEMPDKGLNRVTANHKVTSVIVEAPQTCCLVSRSMQEARIPAVAQGPSHLATPALAIQQASTCSSNVISFQSANTAGHTRPVPLHPPAPAPTPPPNVLLGPGEVAGPAQAPQHRRALPRVVAGGLAASSAAGPGAVAPAAHTSTV